LDHPKKKKRLQRKEPVRQPTYRQGAIDGWTS
jgi:hypothetical protein